jgi:hypothetical protein
MQHLTKELYRTVSLAENYKKTSNAHAWDCRPADGRPADGRPADGRPTHAALQTKQAGVSAPLAYQLGFVAG